MNGAASTIRAKAGSCARCRFQLGRPRRREDQRRQHVPQPGRVQALGADLGSGRRWGASYGHGPCSRSWTPVTAEARPHALTNWRSRSVNGPMFGPLAGERSTPTRASSGPWRVHAGPAASAGHTDAAPKRRGLLQRARLRGARRGSGPDESCWPQRDRAGAVRAFGLAAPTDAYSVCREVRDQAATADPVSLGR